MPDEEPAAPADAIDARLLERLLEAREKFVAYVARRVPTPELAEDVVQESLLKAMRAAPSLRDEERLASWFYRILQNAIADSYRRAAVESRYVSRADPPEGAPEADREAERAICACFYELLPALKPEYAELIRALELGDEQPTEAAGRLGISANNLKVRRHRARQALRSRLEEMCRLCARDRCLDCSCRDSRTPAV